MNHRVTILACVPLLGLSAAAHAATFSLASRWCPAPLWNATTQTCTVDRVGTIRRDECINTRGRTAPLPVDDEDVVLSFAADGVVTVEALHGLLLAEFDPRGSQVISVCLGDFLGSPATDIGFETDAGDLWVLENLSDWR